MDINTKMAVMDNRLKHVEETMTTMGSSNDKNFEKIIEKIDNLDKKFASKLTEKIVYGLVGVILMGVIGGVLSLIITK